jgi:uncharacterized protein YbaR (Trm112 family)
MTPATPSGIEGTAIPEELLKVLACPACDERPPVESVNGGRFLRCTRCRRRYPVQEGIPVMLVDEAIAGEE